MTDKNCYVLWLNPIVKVGPIDLWAQKQEKAHHGATLVSSLCMSSSSINHRVLFWVRSFEPPLSSRGFACCRRRFLLFSDRHCPLLELVTNSAFRVRCLALKSASLPVVSSIVSRSTRFGLRTIQCWLWVILFGSLFTKGLVQIG
ncbi:hypothetical protein Drorol1_Dr00011840 [Drosera rotundifolia]